MFLLKRKYSFPIGIVAFSLLNLTSLFITIRIDNKIIFFQSQLKSSKQSLESQGKLIQNLSGEIQQLKENYQKLNESLSKEVSFKEGLKFVFAFEGGYSDDAGDFGGETNLGITHGEYDQYRASKGLGSRSVAFISLGEATDIYRHKYWLDSGCGETPRRIAISCLDWQVNSGRGVTTLQKTLGNIAVDGLIGSQTMNELSSWLSKPTGEDHLLHNYFQQREDAYRRWGVGSQAKFLQGWLRRAETLKKYLHVP